VLTLAAAGEGYPGYFRLLAQTGIYFSAPLPSWLARPLGRADDTRTNLGCSNLVVSQSALNALRIQKTNQSDIIAVVNADDSASSALVPSTARGALEGECKQVTVLFCDIANSTALAERIGAEAMLTLLNRFFELALGEDAP
jgi:hypothetical protein